MQTTKTERLLVTANEIAEMVGVSSRTIGRWDSSGKVPESTFYLARSALTSSAILTTATRRVSIKKYSHRVKSLRVPFKMLNATREKPLRLCPAPSI